MVYCVAVTVYCGCDSDLFCFDSCSFWFSDCLVWLLHFNSMTFVVFVLVGGFVCVLDYCVKVVCVNSVVCLFWIY